MEHKISVVIADRRQDEQALRESEEKYRNLFETMTEVSPPRDRA